MKKEKNQVSTQEQAPVAVSATTQSDWVINCNKCGASLNIKSNGNAYICPVCGTLFRVQTGKRMVKEVAKERKVQLNLTLTARAFDYIKANEVTVGKAPSKKLSARKVKKAMKKLQKAMSVIVANNAPVSSLNDGDSVLVDVDANNALSVKKQ